jgi:hypothetical protein
MAGILHEDVCSFTVGSRLILLKMTSAVNKTCRENQDTHFMSSTSFSEYRAVYEVMWKNMVEPDRNHMTIRRMRCACYITKATDTYSEYVILIAFPRKQWLTRKRLVIAFMCIMLLLFRTITMVDEVTAAAAFRCLEFYDRVR